MRVLGLQDLPDRWGRATWLELCALLAAWQGERTRQERVETFDGADACVTPC